jgi:hypothetical protein
MQLGKEQSIGTAADEEEVVPVEAPRSAPAPARAPVQPAATSVAVATATEEALSPAPG